MKTAAPKSHPHLARLAKTPANPAPAVKARQAARPAAPPATAEPPVATVLLAVTGMSPAILTETVWALAQEQPPVVPDRVIVLTTTQGRQEIERLLFSPAPRFGGLAPWQALHDALLARGLDLNGKLRFGATGDDIRVFTKLDRATGRSLELPDIRSPEDNAAAADFILEQVRGLVENPDIHLIASLAGGRKTMGALLYACLSLVGRETDRLTHVLVNEPFDTLREFFFPAQPGGPLATRDGAPIDPADARPELADVTFVALRNLFVRELGRKAGAFHHLVERCREDIRRRAGEEVTLTLETRRNRCEVSGAEVRPSPREHLLLLFLARRAKQAEGAFGGYKDAVEPLNEFREQQCRAASPNDFGDWRHHDSLRRQVEEADIRRLLSDLRRKLRQAGGGALRLLPCLPEAHRCSLEVLSQSIWIK